MQEANPCRKDLDNLHAFDFGTLASENAVDHGAAPGRLVVPHNPGDFQLRWGGGGSTDGGFS